MVLSSNLFPIWLFDKLTDYITPGLVLKLNLLKERLGMPSFKNFEKWYTRFT